MDLRVSRRQLLDVAYRGLRVKGVLSGVATDTARDVLALEETHGCGLAALDRLLNHGGKRPDAGADGQPDALKAACAGDPDRGLLQACGASGLLLGEPLAELALSRQPGAVSVTDLAQAAGLEPALRRRAELCGGRYEVRIVDGPVLLSIDRDSCTYGPAWDASWTRILSVEVRRVHDLSMDSGATVVQQPPAVSDGMTVNSELWCRLSQVAAEYLV